MSITAQPSPVRPLPRPTAAPTPTASTAAAPVATVATAANAVAQTASTVAAPAVSTAAAGAGLSVPASADSFRQAGPKAFSSALPAAANRPVAAPVSEKDVKTALFQDPGAWTRMDEPSQKKWLSMALTQGLDPARIPDALLQDPQVAKVAVEADIRVLNRVPASLQHELPIVQAAIHATSYRRGLASPRQAKDAVVDYLRTLPADLLRKPEIGAQVVTSLSVDHGFTALQELGLGQQFSDRQWLVSMAQNSQGYNVDNVFAHAAPELQKDRGFQRQFVLIHPELLGDLKEKFQLDDAPLRSDRALMEALIAKGSMNYLQASPELKRDPAFLEKALQAGMHASYLLTLGKWMPGQPLHQNPGMLTKLLQFDPECLRLYIPDYELKDPDLRDLMKQAITRDPRILASCSEALQMDPEFSALAGKSSGPAAASAASVRAALLAGIRDGRKGFPDFPPQLRKDPELTLAALENWTGQISYPLSEHARTQWNTVAPELRQDPDFQRRAVEAVPHLLGQVDPALQADKPLVQKLVQSSPNSLQFASDALRADRDVVRLAVQTNGQSLEHAAPSLKADRDVVLAAVQNDGRALELAHPELKKDRTIGLAAVRDIEFSFKHLDPQLQADPEIAFEAFRMRTKNFNDPALAEPLRADRDFVKKLVLANVQSYLRIPSPHFRDPAFRAEIAMAFPPLLDKAEPEEREALMKARPELRQRYESVKSQLAQLGIEDPMRLRSADLLNEVLANRMGPRAQNDTRPTAILVFARQNTDRERAFDRNNLADLTRNYRVQYYEAGSEQDLLHALKDGSKSGSAALAVIGGHGNQEGVNLGGEPGFSYEKAKRDEAQELDLSDESQMKEAALQAALRPDAQIVLESCSTGQGGNEDNNVANMLARSFPGREVLAPLVPVYMKLRLDGQGAFLDPGYKTDGRSGDLLTYRARHTG